MEVAGKRSIYLIILVLILGGGLSTDRQLRADSDGTTASSPDPLVCKTITPSQIDSTLPIPVLDSLPRYSNTMSIPLTWQCLDDPRIVCYYSEASLDKFFSSVMTSDHVNTGLCQGPLIVNGITRIWFRVRSVSKGPKYSLPSNEVFTTVDIVNPKLDSICLSKTGEKRITQIEVTYFGSDPGPAGCDSLIVWNEQEGNRQAFEFGGSGASILYETSVYKGRLIVKACLKDKAGNVSNTLDKGIDIVETDYEHCYPNPFNPESDITNLVVYFDKAMRATIRIYDAFGNLVLERDVNGIAGKNDGASNPEFRWDGRNGSSQMVGNGGYICVIDPDGSKPMKIRIAVRKAKD